MKLKTQQWYEAIDKYGDEEEPWHNYFFGLGDTVKYISVEPGFRDSYYIEESMDEFEMNILDNYELEETGLTTMLMNEALKGLVDESKENKRKIIKGFFKNEIK